MDGQMSIFDFIKDAPISLEDLPEHEMIMKLQEATGLQFERKDYSGKYGDGLYEYEARRYGARFTAQYDNYVIDDCRRFIGVGYDIGKCGGGSPCDSLEEAIKRMKEWMERAKSVTGRK